MSDRDDVISANTAFYAAFAQGDKDAMDRVWARNAPVVCIHPGWTALQGRDVVMESWEAILAQPPAIDGQILSVTLFGDAALVICREILSSTVLAASNIFVREDGGWLMVHHHGGPTAEDPPTQKPSRAIH